MKGYLLDVNVLVALGWPNHPHHAAAHDWLAGKERSGWATCSVTQLAFVRLSTHPKFTRTPKTMSEALDALRELSSLEAHRYWRERNGGIGEPVMARVFARVYVHGAVTDAYLIALAVQNGGKLATFDTGAKRLSPEAVDLLPLRV